MTQSEATKGRPKEIRLNPDAEVSEMGHVELYARERKTVHGMTYVEASTRVLRLPAGALFLMVLDARWIVRGVRLTEQVLLEEGRVFYLLDSEQPIIIQEGDRLGMMQPMASQKVNVKLGEPDGGE